MLAPSKKIKNRLTKILASSNVTSVGKRATILVIMQIKNQETSLGLGNLHIDDCS